MANLLHGLAVDAPAKGFLALTPGVAWTHSATNTFSQASAKGAPDGDVVEYAVVVDGNGSIYVFEGDATGKNVVTVPGMKVTSATPLNGRCHGSGVAGLSFRSPDGAQGYAIIGARKFTEVA